MAQGAGRNFLVKKNSTVLASVRTKSVNWAGSPIDITSDDDNGETTYLADEFANKSLEISVSGLTDDDVLSDLAFSTTDGDKHLSDITLTRPNGDVISGTFIMTSYSETGEYEGAVTFEATLVRSGVHTMTAAT